MELIYLIKNLQFSCNFKTISF